VAVGARRRFIVDYEIRATEGHWIAGYYVDLPEGWGGQEAVSKPVGYALA
jgi:hypothetical protein